MKKKRKFYHKITPQLIANELIDIRINLNIQKIIPLIHRISISGNYNYNELVRKLGKLMEDTKYIPDERMPGYDKKYFRQFKDGNNITIFVNPNIPGMPYCYIQFSYPTNQFLQYLNNKLPGLKMSKVEYTIDCFCRDNSKFFDALRHNLFIPRAREAYLEQVDNGNRTYRVWIVKLYERGDDSKKQNDDSYLQKDIDRVRLEFTAPYRILKKYGIGYLSSFIDNPKFFEINCDLYHFCSFRDNSRVLPGLGERYDAEDKNGHKGAFQQQYIRDRHNGSVKNILQSKVDLPIFYDFKWDLLIKMLEFDDAWKAA
jgi:hypothetical protein|tara:strand:- start:637 stop:1578 length:942 start_codon:yes stop_codon:yes gene_type:complete